jgi:ABC-type transporter Mla subunit MlaD
MNENLPNPTTAASIKAAASEAVQQGGDIRSRVRDLTLQALKTRSVQLDEIKQVVGAVTEGISLGLDKRGTEVKTALSEALAGLDEALTKSAEATQLALRQLASQGRDFSENELRDALEYLKHLQEEFLFTVNHIADTASDRMKIEWAGLLEHARRAGTDTGAKVADTLAEFGKRAQATASDGAVTGGRAARELSVRLAQAASGIFAGLADALKEEPKQRK